MKGIRQTLTALAIATLVVTPQVQALELKTDEDKVSYSLGVDLGSKFREQSVDIKEDIFLQGLKDGRSDQPALLSDEQVQQTLISFQKKMIEKQQKERLVEADKNAKAGDSFLAKNKKASGIKTTDSGLQYRVIKSGKGTPPKASDTVTTHYKGRLLDGTEFDSSYERGEPVKFAVEGVIPGWSEALQLMKPGGKWELFIPSKLAYGEHGVGRVIGPNSTLIFEVELLSIEKDQEQRS